MRREVGATLAGLVKMHGVQGAIEKVDGFLLTKNTKAEAKYWTMIRSHLLDML